MSQSDGRQSEVTRLLNGIREEYEAATRGLSGLAQGNARHSFITARMENMGKLQTKLNNLVGDDSAIVLVVQAIEQVPDTDNP
jgi:hypothetical protein